MAGLWPCVPRASAWGTPRAGGNAQLLPAQRAGSPAGGCRGAGALGGGRSDAFQLKLVRQRYFKYIGLRKMVVSFAGAD